MHKDIYGNQEGHSELKLALFADDVILLLKNLNIYVPTLKDLIETFGKKISIVKLMIQNHLPCYFMNQRGRIARFMLLPSIQSPITFAQINYDLILEATTS